MSYQSKFEGWHNITVDDLVIAYRKAKADCYQEQHFPTAVKFIEYEQHLYDNLSNLQQRLTSDEKKTGRSDF